MTTIDGIDLSSVTIDGEKVKEITVDGDKVYSYLPKENLVAWYDFNEAITSGRYCPNDKSGNGYDLSGLNYHVPTNTTSINGRAATKIPESEASFYNGDISGQDPYAYVAVMKLDPTLASDRNAGDGFRYISRAVDDFDQPAFGEFDSFEISDGFRPGGRYGTDIGFGNDVVQSGHVYTVIVDPNNMAIRIDGTEITQTTEYTPIDSRIDYLSIGGLNSQIPGGGYGNGFVGAFGEFVLLDDPSDALEWEQILMDKWGL